MMWCHTFLELGIKGRNVSEEDEQFVLSGIPEDLTGKSVLDLGAFDGFYSYMASKRGAKFVVALDNGMGEEILNGPDQGNGSPDMSYPNYEERQKAMDRCYQKYSLLKTKNSNIHFVPLDVYDMNKLVPDFDVIFCFGLHYHLKNVYELFEKCYEKCKEMLIVGGLINDSSTAKTPDFYFLGAGEIHNDPTSFWVPSPFGLTKLLTRIGFSKIELVGFRNGRILLRCYK